MSNYWAIAIGINQYQQLQPLLYAQWDAQALWNYWVKEGGIPPHQCLLITDGMVSDQGIAAVPTYAGITQHLDHLSQQLAADDVVWCFFSGYGVHAAGKDYLLPLDGDPNRPETSAFSAEYFFAQLKDLPTRNVFVLLDLKQLPTTDVTAMRLGDDVIQQAQATDTALLLASKPDQTSNETLTLRQGLFTFAVIEGLRTQGCSSFKPLAEYVQSRLPGLSEYHWRDRQDAVVVMTEAQGRYGLLPHGASEPAMAGAAPGGLGAVRSPRTLAPPLPPRQESGVATITMPPLTPPPDSTRQDTPASSTPSVRLPRLDQEAENLVYAVPSSTPVSTFPSPTITHPSPDSPGAADREVSPPNHSPDSPDATIQPYPKPNDPRVAPASDPQTKASTPWLSTFWARLSLLAAAVLALVILRNLPAFRGTQTPSTPPTPVTSTPVAPPLIDPEPGIDPDADAADPTATDPTPLPPESTGDAGNENSNGNEGGGTGGVSPSGESRSALENAQIAFDNGQYGEAWTWLNQVPPNAQTQDYATLRAETEQVLDQSGQLSQVMLDEAIASLNQQRPETVVNQASDFSRAIALASRIQPGQPSYEDAQGYIQRWAQVILDLAKARAQSGDYRTAVGAASLIEPNLPTLYNEAQALIATLQSQVQEGDLNQDIIAVAKASIVANSASSYNRAISQLRSIQAGQPHYDDAQQLIEDWSREILAIAERRDARGEREDAIAAAKLVPEGSSVYGQAQERLNTWQ